MEYRVYAPTPQVVNALVSAGAKVVNGVIVPSKEMVESVKPMVEQVMKIMSSTRLSSLADIARLYATLSKLGVPAVRLELAGHRAVLEVGFYIDGLGVILEYPVRVAPGGITVANMPAAATIAVLQPEAIRMLVAKR